MTDTGEHSEFTEQERRALEAWEAPPPPPDLARQVLARAGVGGTAASRWRVWAALAAGIAVVLAATWALWPRHSAGRLEAMGRTTVALGSRAVAVAEDGSVLTWQVEGKGVRVVQSSGNVFYRVDRGTSFSVQTRSGTVRVLGTCFRLEVSEMKASKAGLIGAAAGAAAATLVMVTVYEGKVLTASPRGERQVEAGQVARMESDRPPRIVGEVGTGARSAGRASVRPGPGAGGAAAPSGAERERLVAEKKRLEGELELLQARLQEANGKASKGKVIDLTKQELVELAKRCELRWDHPPLGSQPPKLDTKAARELGLNETERAAIEKAFADYHTRMNTELRKLYVEVTGDDKVADSLSPWAMMSEIEDKSLKQEIKQVFQRLARERAGLQAPPADTSTGSAVERMFRLLTTAGDQLERTIGEQIGPDLARRYREARGGFGSRSRSSHGCPGDSAP